MTCTGQDSYIYSVQQCTVNPFQAIQEKDYHKWENFVERLSGNLERHSLSPKHSRVPKDTINAILV